MKKTILFLIVITTIACGCNKELQREKKILGDHTITDYSVNGIDSLNQYKDSLGSNFHFYYNSNGNEYGCLISGARNDGTANQLVWLWRGSDLYADLIILNSVGSIGIGPIGDSKKPTWKIINLTQKEFQLETVFNDKKYNLVLKNI